MRCLRVRLMAGFLATLAPVLAGGQDASPGKTGGAGGELAARFDGGRKWAVVIGVNKYLDPAIPRLECCVADAGLVATTLVERCGYEDRRMLLITDDQKADHLRPLGINLRKQIAGWLKNCEAGDTVLVFFAGHGFLDARGQAFLAPQDCEKENLGLTGFRVDDLRDALLHCRASQKLLVLDCCHAGGVRSGTSPGASSSELGMAFRDAAGLITLASCQKQEQSREWSEKGHGLFTFFLAQGLQGAADFDHDGVVNSDELFRYTYDQVRITAQRDLNAQQTPVRFIPPDVLGLFGLARVEPKDSRPPSPSLQRTTPRSTDPMPVDPPRVSTSRPQSSAPMAPVVSDEPLLNAVALRSMLAAGDAHWYKGQLASALQLYDWGARLAPASAEVRARQAGARFAARREGEAPPGQAMTLILGADAELKEEDKSMGTVRKGWMVEVDRAKGDWLWVSSAREDRWLSGWINRTAVHLGAAPTGPPSESGALAGSTWEIRDSDGDRWLLLFGDGGVLYFLTGRGFSADATWTQSGASDWQATLHGLVTLQGQRSGDTIQGTAFGASGQAWTWQGRRH